MSDDEPIGVGNYIRHNGRPEDGPWKVVEVNGDKITCILLDEYSQERRKVFRRDAVYLDAWNNGPLDYLQG